ncbi:MAG: hypothetical protein K0S04_1670 [Herbinix sp.]|nr:hypothetical protein [Herbinix sp.]
MDIKSGEAMKKGKLNQKGYTLIELIVTILITGIIAVIISVFVTVSRNAYEAVRQEAVLQEEAQMADSYIGDIAIEAYQFSTASFTIGSDNYQVLNITAPDPDYISGERHPYYFIILWEETTQTLRFCKVKNDAKLEANGTYTLPVDSKLKFLSGTSNLDYATMLSAGNLNIINNPRALLAQYVTNMVVVLPNVSTGSDMAKITLRFSYHDRDYVLTRNIKGRNMR